MGDNKVYLVPHDILESWRSRIKLENADQPLTSEVMRADSELTRAVNAPGGDDHNKSALVGQKLAGYLESRQRRSPAVAPPPQPSQDVPLNLFSKTYRGKSESLLQLLKNNPRISWDDKLRVSVDGNPIPGSSLVDMIADVTTRSKSAARPLGHEVFRDLLRDMNAPRSLINNPAYATPLPVDPPAALDWTKYKPISDTASDSDDYEATYTPAKTVYRSRRAKALKPPWASAKPKNPRSKGTPARKFTPQRPKITRAKRPKTLPIQWDNA